MKIEIEHTPQEKIIDQVRDERLRQDGQWGGHNHDDAHTQEDWIHLVEFHMVKAMRSDRGRFRQQMIRVAALAVAAVESRDRVCKRLDDADAGGGYV